MTTLAILRRAQIMDVLAAQTIELPSWAFGNSGTRFKVFPQPGLPRDPYEKIADAAQVHKYRARLRGSRCTSRGTGSTTTPSWPLTRPTSAWRSARSTPTCSRTTTTGSAR